MLWKVYLVAVAAFAGMMGVYPYRLHQREKTKLELSARLSRFCATSTACGTVARDSDDCVIAAYDLYGHYSKYLGVRSQAGFDPDAYVECVNARAGKVVIPLERRPEFRL